MNQEKAWELARKAYDAAELAADEQYAVSIFCACATGGVPAHAIGDAEAQFDLAMRIARQTLDVARFAWQA